jgi:hypothetical protein
MAALTDRLRTALNESNVPVAGQEPLPRLAMLGVQNGVIDPGNADSVMGVAVMANLALVS